MFKYLSLVVYILVLMVVSRGIKLSSSRVRYLKGQSDNVKVITYLYIVFWLVLQILSFSSLSTYLHIDDYTYSQLVGVWFLNIMALVVLVEK